MRGQRSVKKKLKELLDLRDELWDMIKENGGPDNKFAYIHLYAIAGLEEQIKLLLWALKK